MKEEEVDKIIKSQINNNVQAPESLKTRIRKEIKNMDNNVDKNKAKK